MHKLFDCEGKKFQCSNESPSKDAEIGLVHWVKLCVFWPCRNLSSSLEKSENLSKMVFELVQTCLSQEQKDVEASGL